MYLSKVNTDVSLKPASSVFRFEKHGPRFMTEILAVSWLDTKIQSWRWGQHFLPKRRQKTSVWIIPTAKNW